MNLFYSQELGFKLLTTCVRNKFHVNLCLKASMLFKWLKQHAIEVNQSYYLVKPTILSMKFKFKRVSLH